jgi:Zn-dependent protease
VDLSPQHIAQGLASYLVLLFSLSVHESAHAWAALRMGDDLAAREGRISLNPIVHLDPVGTVLVPLLQILFSGIPFLMWAKPVPVLPHRFEKYRKGQVLVAAAGPISNALLAVLFLAALIVVVKTGLAAPDTPILFLAFTGVQINLLFAVFNLIPIPPLDGSKVASFGLPRAWGDVYDRVVEPYGMWLLLLLVATPVAGLIISPPLRLTHYLIMRILAL